MTTQTLTRGTIVGYGVRLLVLAATVVGAASCGDLARAGKSPAYLIIDSLTAASGADPGAFGSQLNSDVQTLVTQTVGGQQVRVPTVFNDLGQATLRGALKNTVSPTSPTAANDITITRYRISFRRSDGQNRPGQDVPYGFDGAVTATISPGSSATVSFDIVRHTNKFEPPLRNLIDSGGLFQINTIAEITFYGRDQAGNDVSVTGSISVNFGDFGDPS